MSSDIRIFVRRRLAPSFRELVMAVLEQGYEVSRTKDGLKVKGPNGVTFTHGTGHDRGSDRNFKRDLKRIGIDVEGG